MVEIKLPHLIRDGFVADIMQDGPDWIVEFYFATNEAILGLPVRFWCIWINSSGPHRQTVGSIVRDNDLVPSFVPGSTYHRERCAHISFDQNLRYFACAANNPSKTFPRLKRHVKLVNCQTWIDAAHLFSLSQKPLPIGTGVCFAEPVKGTFALIETPRLASACISEDGLTALAVLDDQKDLVQKALVIDNPLV